MKFIIAQSSYSTDNYSVPRPPVASQFGIAKEIGHRGLDWEPTMSNPAPPPPPWMVETL